MQSGVEKAAVVGLDVAMAILAVDVLRVTGWGWQAMATAAGGFRSASFRPLGRSVATARGTSERKCCTMTVGAIAGPLLVHYRRAVRRGDARKGELSGQKRVDVPLLKDGAGDNVTLFAGHGARGDRTCDVGFMGSDPSEGRGPIAGHVLGRCRVVIVAVTSRAGHRDCGLNDAIHVKLGRTDSARLVDHRLMA